MALLPAPRAPSEAAARESQYLPVAVAIAVSALYVGILLFTTLLDPYRFRTPYAIPIFDVPFALVAIGIGYLCLERHRLRQDRESAAIGVTLLLTALLAIAHIAAQPDYPANPGVNPGIAPYYFFGCFFAGLAGIGLAAHNGYRAFPLTEPQRFSIGVAVTLLGVLVALAVPYIQRTLPPLVMPPGRFTPFTLWSAGLILTGLVVWVFWGGRKRFFGRESDLFASYLVLVVLVWMVGLLGFLASGGFRYSIPWYLAGLSRPLGVGLIFVGLLREQVWLYREARERQRDLARSLEELTLKAKNDETLHGFCQRLLEAMEEPEIVQDAVRTTHGLLWAECVALFLFDPKSEELRLEAGLGWPGDTGSMSALASSNEPSRALTFAPRELLEVEDLTRETRGPIPPHLLPYAVGAGIFVPLGSRKPPLGVLAAYHRAPHRWSDEERRVVTTLAHQTALALDKARFYAELQTNLERLKETQAQLIQTDKLKALGTLLSGMAHELNNPLSTILMSVQLLKQRQSLADPIRVRLNVVEEECQRAARIIRELLVFARRKPPERRRVNLNEVVRAALSLEAPQLELRRIRLVSELGAVPPVWGDAHQLQQVLLNLLTNARDAMKDLPEGAVLTVRSWAGADTVMLEVADTGRGIAPEHLNRVFDPFFTTKGVGEGTGLGLSLSIGIVEAHGGTMRIESVAGAGARVTLALPLGDEPEGTETTPSVAPNAPGGRILVVEDEAPLRAILTELLVSLGHSVDEAATGRIALERLQSGSYDLIALDLKLPDTDGTVIWHWLRAHHPEQAARVVFMTGDTMSAETQSFLEEAGCPVLSKPLAVDQLTRMVATVLARG